MLGKLFKHEFIATGRHFLLMYALFFIITIFNKICLEVTITNNRFWSAFQGLFMFFYVLTCAAIFVITAVLIVSRFYKNLMCDEGYLMFTLPVTVNQHIIVKGITAYIWSVLSSLIFLLSVLLLLCGHGIGDFLHEALDVIGLAAKYCGNQLYLCIFIYVIAIIIGGFYNILQVYMAIAIGQLVNKHRVLTAFAAYFGINFLIQNITSFGLIFSNAFDPGFAYIENESQMMNGFFQYMNTIGLISLIFSIVLGIAYFFITSFILNKKLNLE